MRASTPALIAVVVSLSSLACSLVIPLLPGSSDSPPALVPAGAPAITLPPVDLSPTGLPETQATGVPDSLPISPEIEAQMAEIEQQVVALRGLSPRTDSQRTLLNAEQLRQRVIDDFLADYTPQEAADDAQVLGLLGLLDPEFDLHNFYIELYSEQVAGYYDDEVQRMFVVADRGFQGPERLTHAHEYVHALQDQTYDFQEGLKYTDEAVRRIRNAAPAFRRWLRATPRCSKSSGRVRTPPSRISRRSSHSTKTTRVRFSIGLPAS